MVGAAHREWLCEACQNARCSHAERVATGKVRHDDNELIATKPRHCISVAHLVHDALRSLCQDDISYGVAKHVVDFLETIEIEKKNRAVCFVAPGVHKLLF